MIYNYKVKDTNGEMASLDEYKGKVLLDADLHHNMKDFKNYMINIKIEGLKY